MRSHVNRLEKRVDSMGGYKQHPVEDTNIITGSFESKSPLRDEHESAISAGDELERFLIAWIAEQNQRFGIHPDDGPKYSYPRSQVAKEERSKIVAYVKDHGLEAAAKDHDLSERQVRRYVDGMKGD